MSKRYGARGKGMERDTAYRDKWGYTLIELVTALSVSVMIGTFLAGFLFQQTSLYRRQSAAAQALSLGGLIYVQLEEQLRYGEHFYPDPQDPGRLFYAVGGRIREQRMQKCGKVLALGSFLWISPRALRQK